jgi:hypothetical protein
MPNWRLGASTEMPALDWVMRYMARNQIVSASLVEAKIVPLVGEVCW